MNIVYLLYCFADNLFVLLLCDFLPLVKGFYGCLHFIYSFLLDLLFLQKTEGIGLVKKKKKGSGHFVERQLGMVTFSFLELSA